MKEEIKNIGRVSSASVFKHTKKNWDQWVHILDEAGARHLIHSDIAKWLQQKYKLSPWWRQIVTGCYEIHIGRRVEGQSLKGTFSLTTTKTLAVNARALWKFLWSEEGQAVWLKPLSPLRLKTKETYETEGGVFGEIRTLKNYERVRLSWSETEWDGSSIVQMLIVPRNKEKCILIFQHENLKNARLRNQLRTHWLQVVEDIQATVSK